MSHRWQILILMAAFWAGSRVALTQDTHFAPQGEEIPGPANPAAIEDHCCAHGGQAPVTQEAFETWLRDITHYRAERLIRAGFKDDQYRNPALLWTERAIIQPQMMIEDRYFYDPATGRYTVGRYLDDLQKRYGGIDAVLIWHTYPNLGVDNRNQYDLLRDMPGGIAGVKQMVSDFHRRGVRVLFPVMLWDQGTRDEGKPNWQATAELMAQIGADGINGDTLQELPLPFLKAAEQTGHALAFQPEGAPQNPAEALAWNTMSWGYFKYPFEPMVSLYKWLEPRHMVNVCDRWARDKTNDLQYAFFNGAGYESWENVWGIWNQIDDRDAEALRRIAAIERAFTPLLSSSGWQPHTPVLQYGVFASKFPADHETLWTFVNRNEYSVAGRQIRLQHQPGIRYFDVWHGVELQPEIRGQSTVLSFAMEPHGYGAILATARLTPEQEKLIAAMHNTSRRELSSFSPGWHSLSQHLVPIQPIRPPTTAPPGMIRIDGGKFTFRVSGMEIEGGNDVGVDVQMPWEDSARRQHLHVMTLSPFYIDRYPVTNREFKRFLDQTQYHPNDDHNFLKDWKNGAHPAGWDEKPVTWVSVEDARAYAAWAGKRLPHEWEWQYAAQGSDGRLYPWGNTWNTKAVPAPQEGRTLDAPADVSSHPIGASPFGVEDLVGNVWQWTDEYRDPHTRAAILRGGSTYRPQGSIWYFPQAYSLDEHGKYLLMAPSIDRSATIGFRCVMDAAPGTP
jgi:iron(II)-dependent oxidoreductase